MKSVIHKLLTSMLLVVLAAFGLIVLSSDSPYEDAPVWGFSDKYCSSEHYKWFRNVGALIAADGKTDPDATGDDVDKIWYWRSYIEDGDDSYTCHLVEYEEVVARGTVPKRQTPPRGGGGGGGGGGEETPTPQEPPPQPSPAELQAQNFTEETSDDLRECLEEDLESVSEEIEGWNSDAIGAAEVTWGVETEDAPGFGVTFSTFEPEFSIDVYVHPNYIGTTVAAMFQTQPDVQVAAFQQLAQFTQAHELFHVGQLKTIFDATNAGPKPYQYWDLEVQAHNGATRLWQGIHGANAEPPSSLNLGSMTNWSRKMAYDLDTASYKLLEEELANPETTEARKKDIKKEMGELEEKLVNPNNLPEANANDNWSPGDIDIDCEE